MIKVAILGAGHIGSAVHQIINNLKGSVLTSDPYHDIETFIVDSGVKWAYQLDLNLASIDDIAKFLSEQGTTHVINALPFTLVKKLAEASVSAGCHYIDFTEDDVMADAVQALYEGSGLTCAVKCGLAPGFINYIGYQLVTEVDNPKSLMISVGALPRTVSYDYNHPEQSYNLTWSVDGLVNEYLRPCRVRKDGKETTIDPLTGLTKVIIDGTEYEAAYTSGGIGSLVKDLADVDNVSYMTLRYPDHYRYVRSVIQDNLGDFEKIKQVFLSNFPSTNDDVIVVYASTLGTDANKRPVRRSYSNKFYGADGLSGIQATTAGSGVAMLELMLTGKAAGIIDHSSISLSDFTSTRAFGKYYKTIK
jgi:saccharopine dehydrogenase-like NADP-dependent oxidoreductase